MLKSKSEKEFFRIIAENRIVNLKYLCKKVARKQVFVILKHIDNIQKTLGEVIFERKAEFCDVTGLPIVKLNFQILNVEINNSLVKLKI
jgi:hypothetical protein